jgi:hypothetical protein
VSLTGGVFAAGIGSPVDLMKARSEDGVPGQRGPGAGKEQPDTPLNGI